MQFQIHHRAKYGDRLVLLGSTDALGQWDPDHALPATWTPGDIWTVSDLPRPRLHAPTRFEFKFCLITAAGALVWEPGPNHAAHLPIHPALPIVLSMEWGSHAVLHVPANPELSPFCTTEHEAMFVASPPPTPSMKYGLVDRGGDGNKLAMAVERVKLDKANGEVGRVAVLFRMEYRLEEGDMLYVGGSIPELGGWNKMHSPIMGRGKKGGKVFEVAMVLPRDDKHACFEYKYFVRRADGTRRWEAGGNRVARPFDHAVGKEGEVIVWDDRWERIRVEFSIYYPTKPSQVMCVTGDPKEIGAWFKPGPTKMELGELEMLETEVKGRKWKLKVWMPTAQTSFSYRYIVVDEESKVELWEREPNRRCEFDDAEEGEALANGVRVLRDVNFVSGLNFDAVPPDMYIGPYPQVPEDVDLMAEGGVTGVFNVQTDEDFKHRGIQWDVLMARYRQHGIDVVRYPIRDFDRDSLKEHLHGAAHALDGMLQAGRKVYIHCTAGMGRAPACAVAYLCWVRNMELMEAVSFVKKHRKVAVPNVPVLEEALKKPY